jgi:general secretion pathway protein A
MVEEISVLTDDTPFFISPSPTSLYLTPSLQATLAKARFTINKRQGLTTVLGDIGLGKSSVMRFLHSEYASKDNIVTTFVTQPAFSSDFAMLKSISLDFGLPPRRSLTAQLEELQAFLLDQYKAGKNTILFIDEAQRLKFKELELIRAFLNFETHRHKLLQIVLAGQLELRERLKNDHHKALFSRIFTSSLLSPLTVSETSEMIGYRCKFSEIINPFPAPVIERIYELTGGVPRAVLTLCALAYEMMLMAGASQVDVDLLESASAESPSAL